MIDSVTGELKGEVLRKGVDSQDDKEVITEDDVKDLLDDWIEQFDESIAESLANKA